MQSGRNFKDVVENGIQLFIRFLFMYERMIEMEIGSFGAVSRTFREALSPVKSFLCGMEGECAECALKMNYPGGTHFPD